MKQVYKIDASGFYIKPVIVENDIPSDCVEIQCPNGLYKPRWDGTEWVEGLTQEEINAIKNKPQEPTAEERLKSLEDAMLFMLGGM